MQTRLPSYQFDFSKLYRIWFSSNPHQFLGLENQKRFVRMRKDNPRQNISFIYYARGLTKKARADLAAFCNRYQITAIDFDLIGTWLKHYNDKMLFQIARNEINNNLNKEGGNLAAASDCLRVIIPVIERLGVYTDFDVECFFKDLPSHVITADAPLLFNGKINKEDNKLYLLANTDFLAFAFNQHYPGRLTLKARDEIRDIQFQIIVKYQPSFSLNALSKPAPLTEIQTRILSEFLQSTKDHSIYKFRQYLLNAMEHHKAQPSIALVYENLYHFTVIRMSGPENFIRLYETEGSDKIRLVNNSCLRNHEVLAKCVIAQNDNDPPLLHADDFYPHADISWAPSGAAAKNKRETEIAALTIQSFYRMSKVRKLFNAARVEQQDDVQPADESWLESACTYTFNACTYVFDYMQEHPKQSALVLLLLIAKASSYRKQDVVIPKFSQ